LTCVTIYIYTMWLFNQVVETHPMLNRLYMYSSLWNYNHAITPSFLETKLYSQLMQSDLYHRKCCDQPTCL